MVFCGSYPFLVFLVGVVVSQLRLCIDACCLLDRKRLFFGWWFPHWFCLLEIRIARPKQSWFSSRYLVIRDLMYFLGMVLKIFIVFILEYVPLPTGGEIFYCLADPSFFVVWLILANDSRTVLVIVCKHVHSVPAHGVSIWYLHNLLFFYLIWFYFIQGGQIFFGSNLLFSLTVYIVGRDFLPGSKVATAGGLCCQYHGQKTPRIGGASVALLASFVCLGVPVKKGVTTCSAIMFAPSSYLLCNHICSAIISAPPSCLLCHHICSIIMSALSSYCSAIIFALWSYALAIKEFGVSHPLQKLQFARA